MSEFSEQLKRIRKEVGLTQIELAENLELIPMTISRYEAGKREPSLDTLIAISKLFNVSVDTLLGVRSDSKEAFTETTEQHSINEDKLLSIFQQLNEDGQEKLLELAEFFITSGKYKKSDKFEVV